MDTYKLHIDLFNTDFIFSDITTASASNTYWLIRLGTSFNLYDWIKNNIYYPHINDSSTYDSEWISIINWLPLGSGGNTRKDYVTQIRLTYNPASVLRGIVRVQVRTANYNNYTDNGYIDYSFTGQEENAKKFLNLFIFEVKNGLYRTSLEIGGYDIYNYVDDVNTYLNVALNACPEVNEMYYFWTNSTHISAEFQNYTSFYEYIEGIEITTTPTDEGDNYSGEGGGKGIVDDRSDYIPSDGLPTVSAISSGFVNLYNPTLANIQSLHTFMMSDGFLENVKKLISNPIDYIISLHLIPVTPTTVGSESIKVGGIDTQVSMPIISSQYLTFDCGTVNVNEYWGSFIDYSPFTKVSIFLPFVGIKELNLDDVMSGQIGVKYRIDVLTGNFMCSLHISSSRKVNAILYNYSGNMSMSIPVSASDYRQKVSAFTQLVGSGAMVAVSGGTSPSADISFASNLANVALSKYGYSRSGNITGDASLLGNYTPYLIISRPNQSLPSKYKGLNGYTSNIGGTVGQFSGYNEFREVKTDGLTCLENEKQMIVDLLQSGVFV